MCLGDLAQDGRAAVRAQPTDLDDADALPVLANLDAAAREALALALPRFSSGPALWGARLFHQLCRFVVCRDLGIEGIDAVCAVPCPGARGPDTDWSVDLTLRHLPRLFALARHLSNGDPLVSRIRRIAADWPLSSVGVPGLAGLRLDSFIGDPGLLRVYADRILAAGDTSRLGDPRVDDRLRADLGLHRDLAPEMAGRLFGGSDDGR